MIVMDPGIMEAAHKQGINFVPDANHNKHVDQSDLDAAIKAKVATVPAMTGK